MIIATFMMELPPNKCDAALKILKSTAVQSRIRSGCLNCNIYGDIEENGLFMYRETWRSWEEMDQHLRSEVYRNLLIVLEMALKEPEIRFDIISNTTGIETIERARGYSNRLNPT